MKILYTKTGSDGNCTVIETESGSLFMIDCGIKLDIVNQKIGYRLNEINYCIVTHHHKDHSGYIQKVLARGIEVHCPLSEIPPIPNSKFCLKGVTEKTIKLKEVTIKPFPLIHTSSNGEKCETYGYLIRENATSEILLWATDTQYIPQKFPPCNIYGLECNYAEVDDYAEVKDYTNTIVERRRIVSHQSLQTAIEFIKKQDLSKCTDIYLIHVSGAEMYRVSEFISKVETAVKENKTSKEGIKINVN